MKRVPTNMVENTNSKVLYYIDKKTGNYIKANCTLNASIGDIAEFFASIERMKLNSTVTGNNSLKKGKTTCDLVKEYKKLLQSDVIDFSDIMDLYEKDQKGQAVALMPAINFLNLFDKKVEEVHTSLDTYFSLRNARNPLFSTSPYEKRKKELKSIVPNTEVLNVPPILNSVIKAQNNIQREKKNPVKRKVRQNKVGLVAS